MRFLHVAPDGTLNLTSDLTTPPGPYAVLSHTWGDRDDEVTFDDIQQQTGTGKTGYAKLWFCANQAKTDGLEYCWVDTCCIDKKSFAELSEAINSMFRWCRDAAKCYVYLSDVSSRGNDDTTEQTLESFQEAEWFTRGWTVQDLRAPSIVEFFSREGYRLGDKRSLERQIQAATGIPTAALRGAPLSYFSSEERFSRAANREYTEIEEYSFLGIFDVFMPITYGEGEHAFLPLREHFQAAVEDFELTLLRSGSLTTFAGEVLAAANEFVSLLVTDDVLETLRSIPFGYIDSNRLERTIRQLLRGFAVGLRQEASGSAEKEAVRLLQLYGRYTAHCLRQRYITSALNSLLDFDSRSAPNTPDLLRVQRYLSYISKQSRNIVDWPHFSAVPEGDSSDSNPSSEVESDQPELSDLVHAKAFILQSAAYHQFKRNLGALLVPYLIPWGQDSKPTISAIAIFLTTWRRLEAKGVELCHGLRMLVRPSVPPGYTRITWICGCGDPRYADIREHRPNAAFMLQESLREHAIVDSANSNGGESSETPRLPPRASLPSTSATHSSLRNTRLPGRGSAVLQVPSQSAAEAASRVPLSHKFLLLCVTIGGAPYLEQINLQEMSNDQYLWEKIRERYHDHRARMVWHQKLSITRWLSTVRWFSRILPTTDLTCANSIQFVRFHLVPIAMDVRPWNFRSPSLPPEEEVRIKKTYHYEPCPMDVDPTGLNQELLHCLWKPGPHLDRFWLNVFPKKLDEALQYVSSKPEANIGWGIHIVEGVDWTSVTFLALILIGISAVLGIVYSAVTHDVGAAFSMSAFLAVVPALGIALLQFKRIK